MSSNENNFKNNFIKKNIQLYSSPYSNKKQILGNIYTEPRNILHEIDSNLSKNQTKQKTNNANINKNLINIQQQEAFSKTTRMHSDLGGKVTQNKNFPQSHKKSNSKVYLKKNNFSALWDTNNNALSTQTNTSSNTNINNLANETKNRLTNIRFNIGKSSQNLINSKNSSNILKKNGGSACELLDTNNYLRESNSKNKNIVDLNNLNPLGYIYSSGNKQKSFLSPQNNGSNPKIIFLKSEKSKYFDENNSKDSKNPQTEGNGQNNNNAEDKKNQINCLYKNTFTNVKIFPTTILNNKIIYNQINKNNQNKKNNENNSKSENSNNNSKTHSNNSKIKKEKIVIDTGDKTIKSSKNENFQSIEELHYFYIDTLQKGKRYAIKLDK